MTFAAAETHDSRESTRLAERLVRCLPGATYEMETLCRLAGVHASRQVGTAAVECTRRPRLLINPDFVAEHCRRDEHVFLLALHELWHVILAHTRLYPRATPAENIAFDAIINAGLARQHPGPEYRGFLERLNPHDAFPALLLRPPRGWPERPRYPRALGPPRTRKLLERLYPRAGALGTSLPLYEEILHLLEARQPVGCVGHDGDAESARDGPPTGTAHDESAPFLLGDHGDPAAEMQALDDPILADVVRRMVSTWPPPPFPIGGRDAGGVTRNWLGALRPAPERVRRAFVRLLRRALGPPPRRATGRLKAPMTLLGGLGPLPNPRDRLAPARRRLGAPTTLSHQTVTTLARRPDSPACAHVYLDVSGSMFELLPHLAGLLVPYVAAGQTAVFQFSTEVEPLSLAELRAGRLRTTGGTDIDCVLEHMVSTRRLRRALVLTDGYVGAGRRDLVERVQTRGLRLHAVLPAESAWRDDLAGVAHTITELPPLRGVGRNPRA